MAREEIERGNVVVSGAPALKASRLVAPEEALALRRERPRFVSRGGEKLDHALGHFGVVVAERIVLDAGASTGGFTDCLLQRRASAVIAVDVGHGQLHERLRTDPRVHVLDRTNVRHLTTTGLPLRGPVDLVVADLSFISLGVVAPALVGLARPGADFVVLVKPQFESGRAAAAKGRGVISDPVLWRGAINGVRDAFAANGAEMISIVASPLLGAQGNAEFLVHLKSGRDAETATRREVEESVDRAVEVALHLQGKTSAPSLAEGG
jgi:23S rRNA (cytidine1920-2'-O)/16S rRNA (cytidine1409-2'-O)-methyltransferase